MSSVAMFDTENTLSLFAKDEIYQVSNFVNLCSKVIRNNIPVVWVRGEISNLSTPSSGHIYFSLKDAKSQIRCVFFKFSQRNLKFKLENGIEIMLRAAPSIYEARSDFQLIVQKVETVGIGNLELGFEQLKKKLKAQGLFEQKHKKPLIKFPNNIAIITSKTGAVVQDIIQVLLVRYPFVTIKIYDTPTQGVGASLKIINALHKADNDNNDTLIIARGGGSREDLWCFNDEDLALAIFNTKTSVISSIGHEIDSTIIDFVADVYAPTPSAAAMLVAPDKLEILQNCQNLENRLKSIATKNLKFLQDKFLQLKTRLTKPSFNKYYQLIDAHILSLKYNFKNTIRFNYSQLQAIHTKLLANNPQNLIKIKQLQNKTLNQKLLTILTQLKIANKQIINLEKQIIVLIKHKIFIEKNNLKKSITAINHLNPLQVLERGYSITSHNNKVLSSGLKLTKGDEIITKFIDSDIKSIIK